VIDGASKIKVILNDKREYDAELLGHDPNTDLALLRIDEKNLPFAMVANSDEVKVGQWVLAVGNPFNLTSTVTAGIVSAKGRTLDINRRQSDSPVESFIQTDAAVNPGNSGGPLISTDGKLIGINSAIASPTGAYAGYSFTIPVNIVKKIIADLIKFGTVQRAYLGIDYPRDNLDDDLKKQNGIKDDGGVYVIKVREGGSAAAAGVKQGDMITKINGVPVMSGAELVGKIATYSPGDKISITYQRGEKEYTSTITLKNSTGTTETVKTSVLDKLGAGLETLSKEDAKELNQKGGVIVKSISQRGLLSKVRIQEGYVIIKANGKDILNVEDLRKVLETTTGTVKLEGIYPGYEGIYPIIINLSGN
jgi:S1-C subfamily serine protease